MCPVAQPCGVAAHTVLLSAGLFPSCMNTSPAVHFLTLAACVNKHIEDISPEFIFLVLSGVHV